MPKIRAPHFGATLTNLPSRRIGSPSCSRDTTTSTSLTWNVETIATELGWVAIAGCGVRVYAVAFGHPTAVAATAAALAKLADDRVPRQALKCGSWHPTLAARLARYAAGQRECFQDIELDLSHLTHFAARVIQTCRGIEWGETLSYGELARRAGSPAAARAVGNVMAANRTPLIVPCHRVVAAHGKLGGFSAPQGTAMKQRLLCLESGTGLIPDPSPLPPL